MRAHARKSKEKPIVLLNLSNNHILANFKLNLDPKKIYMMPLLMGPVADRTKGAKYESVEIFSLQYKTDYDSVKALLPKGYEPYDDPSVNIAFSFYDGVDFMAGKGYNVVFVVLAAKYQGKTDNLEGDYVLVILENDTVPIISGRELLGAPKIYADISSPEVLTDNNHRCEAFLWGHLLLGAEFGPMKKQNLVVRKMGGRMLSGRPWMTHKYIPSLEGEPDADYPIANWSDSKMEELWLGKTGRLYLGEAGVEDIGVFKGIIDAIGSLPVHEISQVSRWRGSQVLRYDRSRRLF
jgi:acetoacetate decarboxylase